MRSYRNMDDMYETIGNYSNTLSFYEKTLEIDQKSLLPIHPDLTVRYYDLGRLHELMGNYSS